jgi:hypothetical protein
MEVDNIV